MATHRIAGPTIYKALRRSLPAAVLLFLTAGAAATPGDEISALKELLNQGSAEEARDHAQSLLDSWERTYGPESKEVAELLDVLVVAVLQGSDEDAAGVLSLAKRLVAAKRGGYGDDDPETARGLQILATVHLQMGDLPGAIAACAEAVAIRERAQGPAHPDLGRALTQYAQNLFDSGNYVAARGQYERAIAVYQESVGPEHERTLDAMESLGSVMFAMGDFDQAIRTTRQVVEIRERVLDAGDHRIGTALLNLGIIARHSGDVASARKHLAGALEIIETSFGSDHPLVAFTLNSLGILMHDAGELPAAREAFERSLAIRERALGPMDRDVGITLINLGNLYSDEGDIESAHAAYERGIAVFEAAHEPFHPEVMMALNQLGWFYWETGNAAAAESVLTRAAGIYEVARLRSSAGFDRALFAESPYTDLAAACLDLGKTVAAWEAVEKDRARVLADLFIAVDQRRVAPEAAAREESLATVMAELKTRSDDLRRRISDSGDPVEGTRLAQLEAEYYRAAGAWSAFQDSAGVRPAESALTLLPLQRIQASLAPDEAIVTWLDAGTKRGRQVSWGCVVRSTGPIHWILLEASGRDTVVGTKDKAQALAGEWMEHIIQGPGLLTSEERADAGTLLAKRLHPLLDYLADAKGLIVVPSGVMLGVPLEAMQDSSGTYLGSAFSISYAPSATTHARLVERRRTRPAGAGATALLIGDPPFSREHRVAMQQVQAPPPSTTVEGSAGILRPLAERVLRGEAGACGDLPRLPGSRREVLELAQLLPGATVLLGPDASEDELARQAAAGGLERYEFLHFATHALIDDQTPEASALILAQAGPADETGFHPVDTATNDGRLTVAEIMRSWTLEADLVSLSACQTGLGQKVNGEGYLGFAHAFLAAGAQSLLLSLWDVDDRATALLMRRFYENLSGPERSGTGPRMTVAMPKAGALQEAKQWLAQYRDESGARPYSHPYFWSAFVLFGDRR